MTSEVEEIKIKDDIGWDREKSSQYVRKMHDRFRDDYYKDAVK